MIPLCQQSQWINRCQKLLIAVGVSGLILFYLILYRPLTNQLNQIHQEIASTESQIRQNQQAAHDLETIKSDIQRLKQQLARSRQLPREQDLAGFLREITGLAQRTGLDKFRCEPANVKRLELCQEMPISLKFSGGFMDVSSFLRQTEEMPRMMRTRGLNIKSKDGKKGLVEAELIVSIFFGAES